LFYKNIINRIVRFPIVLQKDRTDCAPACIKMILKHNNVDNHSLGDLRNICYTDKEGTSLEQLQNVLRKLNFSSTYKTNCIDYLSKITSPTT